MQGSPKSCARLWVESWKDGHRELEQWSGIGKTLRVLEERSRLGRADFRLYPAGQEKPELGVGMGLGNLGQGQKHQSL